MKKFFLALCLGLLVLCNETTAQNYYYICKDRSYQTVEIDNGMELPLDWTDIDSITFSVPQFPVVPTPTDGDTVRITYSGSSVSVAIPDKYAGLVTSSGTGGDLVINSTASDEEIIYKLTGTSTSGSLTFYGSYKATFVLDNLNLTSTSGAAMNILCGKRIAIELAEGSSNSLTDASDGEQKACLYVKGHTEFSKGGSLTVTGNSKHAISSKEYILIKKTIGTITVNSAVKDGIHAGQYFKMNGGKLNILNGVGEDGIQAEVTDNSEDECNGQIIIEGGELNVNLKSDYSKCLKADSLCTVVDGVMTLTQAGKSGYKPDEEEEEEEAAASYMVYVSVPATSGGGGGGGWPGGGGGGGDSYYWNQEHVYLYDNSVKLVATLTKKVSINGTSFFCYDFGQAASGTYYFKSDNYQSRNSQTSYAIRSKAINLNLDGSSDRFFVISSSYTTSGTTRTFTITDNTSTYKNGTVSSGDVTYATCIKADSYRQEGGTINMTASGIAGRGISVDADLTTTGGDNTITCSGAGAKIGTSDCYAGRGYMVDGNLYLYGGSHTIKMTGSGGKGIKVDGNAVVGEDKDSKLTLSVTTTGASVGTTSSGGDQGFIGSTKAIKVMGSYTQNGGDVSVSTSKNGAEGIESKSTMDFNGGTIYAKCYDDCINSAGKQTYAGTMVYCLGTGNDAIDSNCNQVGGITITGGAVVAFSTKGDPEEGIDLDQMSNVVIKGGYLFAGGGRQQNVSSLSSSSTQSYGIYSNTVSLTSGRYYTVLDNSSNSLFTVKMPATVSSKLTIITATGLTKSKANYVKYSTAQPTDATSQFGDYIYIGGTTGTLTNAFSITGK